MKKVFIRWTALMMAVVLLLATLALPALAAEPTTGSLTIYKYSPLSGEPWNDGQAPGGDQKLIKGVEFTYYKVADWTQNPGQGTNGIFNSLVSGIDFNGADLPNAAAVYNEVKGGTATGSAKTGDSGSIRWSDLPLGLYLVAETNVTGAAFVADGEPANITKLGDPFLVAIPTTNVAGDGLLYDVTVHPKNATGSIVKTVDDPVVGVGQEVGYTIEVSVPENLDEILNFTVKDLLPKELDYKSAVVYTGDPKGKEAAELATMELGSENYSFTPPTGGAVKGAELTFVFPSAADKAPAFAGVDSLYIRIITTVNSDAILVNEITNTASIKYGDHATEFSSDPAVSKVGKATITKTDQNNGDLLSEVEFKIYTLEAEVKSYVKDPTNPAQDYVATTNASGVAEFLGLKPGTYYIEETKAKDGYQLLKDPVEIVVPADGDGAHVSVGITNVKKFTLPNTGGSGTLLFAALGLAVIGGGGFLLLKGKREEKA